MIHNKKRCIKCRKAEDLDHFFNNKYSKDGKDYYCKTCRASIKRDDYTKHKDKRLQSFKRYKRNNPTKIKIWRQRDYENNKEQYAERARNWIKNNILKSKIIKKRYKQRHKAEILAKERERWRIDSTYKLKKNLRLRIRIALKNNQKSGSAVRDLGCSILELKKHLESQFQSGMTWDNWSINGWHIDHIKALAGFDLTDRKEFLKACHYTNLQPLWAKDNWSKGNR